jgi:hypothetical protein
LGEIYGTIGHPNGEVPMKTHPEKLKAEFLAEAEALFDLR